MNSTTSLMLVALVAIVGTMSIASEAHASNLPLTVEADKSVYDHESTITVTGQVASVVPGYEVTIVVVSPLNSIVTIDQINVLVIYGNTMVHTPLK